VVSHVFQLFAMGRLPHLAAVGMLTPVSKTGGWGFESLHSCQPLFN
jgi:hypothetical protein